MRRAAFCIAALATAIPMQHCAGDPAGQVLTATGI